jgi:hypothetical protein
LEVASCRPSFAPSLQLIGNLVDAGLRAVIILARCARDADRPDDFVPTLIGNPPSIARTRE